MTQATQALDKLSEDPSLEVEDLLREIAARGEYIEEEKYRSLPSNRVDLEKQRNKLLGEMSMHICRSCDDGRKCSRRLRWDKDFKRVQRAINAMPTRDEGSSRASSLRLELHP